MDQYDKLDSMSYADAKSLASVLIADSRKFDVRFAVYPVVNDGSMPPFVGEFFSVYESVFVRFGELRILRTSLLNVDVDGRPFTRVGFDVDGLSVLLDANGRVWEWDEEVLDGPCAPSGWHYLVWVCHLVYDTPIAPLSY